MIGSEMGRLIMGIFYIIALWVGFFFLFVGLIALLMVVFIFPSVSSFWFGVPLILAAIFFLLSWWGRIVIQRTEKRYYMNRQNDIRHTKWFIPDEIRKVVGSALSEDNLQMFWGQPHDLLDGNSPQELWAAGEKQKVLAFIESAKNGDMA